VLHYLGLAPFEKRSSMPPAGEENRRRAAAEGGDGLATCPSHSGKEKVQTASRSKTVCSEKSRARKKRKKKVTEPLYKRN